MRNIVLLAFASVAFGQTQAGDFFETRVRPVLAARCASCHGAQAQMGGKRFDTREAFLASGVVSPGDPDGSPLIRAVRYDGKVKMPPTGELPDHEVAALAEWVRAGAYWPETARKVTGTLWSLKPVVKPAPPAVKNTAWPRNAIDRFVLAELEAKGIPPAGDASRHALLRRITLDLTGLLPARDEIEAFVADASPRALECVVDRLLSSNAFGDRWGRHWLDVTYYADTTGVGRRIPLKQAWRYRDYVIASFNSSKPHDVFLREQIAGAGGDAAAATGFLALGPWAWFAYDKVQMRHDVADLQVDLIGRSVLGMTLGCARCHDHKFDPVTNKDYFAMAGIFLSTKTTSRNNSEGGINLVRLPETVATVEQHAAALRAWEEHVAATEAETALHQKHQKAVRDEIEALKAKPASDAVEAAIKDAEQRLAELKKKTEHAPDRQILAFTKFMKPEWPQVYAAEEMEFPEDARIASRGDAHQLGESVPRGFPKAILPGDAVDPHSSGRKELAAWLTDPKNPLTARVWANRVWHHLFGTGIVASPDNFGSRGEAPSHPGLLDYLAARLVENEWSTKKLITEIVLSRTYQLAAGSHAVGRERDPSNRLLWRASRRRLEAEAIRDTILQASGGLDTGRGGPSLPLTARNVHTIAPFFLEDDSLVEPPVKYRRTVYQPVMRSSQMIDVDILNVFDSKDPDQVVGARPATTVPSQMLYLMNAPFIREESQRWARALVARHASVAARVDEVILTALSRPSEPRDHEQARQFLAGFRAETEADAWARYCHAIFASSEFLYRR